MKDRFVKTYEQGVLNLTEIWVDTLTGVNYVYHCTGSAAGMTVLLDRDGRPVISPLPIGDN